MDYQVAVKVSAGFAGGMNLGSVCGAVTGGIMAIGLKHGGVERAAQLHTSRVVREFVERFRAKHRAVNCTELLGVDLSTFDMSKPEVLKAAMEKGVFAVCPRLVADAATILEELLSRA